VESGIMGAMANPLLLWFLIGVPRNQWKQIVKGRRPEVFFDAIGDGLYSHSLVGRDNYFWSWFLRGRFDRGCCPRYLRPESLHRLKDGRLARLRVMHDTFANVAR